MAIERPQVTDHDATTGETIVRDMTDDELAQAEADHATAPAPPA